MSNIIENKQKLYQHPIYSDYACNLNGEIFSKKYSCRNKTCEFKKLNLSTNHYGYLKFCLCYDKKHFNKKVHQFILEAFYRLIPIWSTKTGDGLTINHLDSNKLNNNFLNLQIVSNRLNNQLRESNKIQNKKYCLPKDVFIKKDQYRNKPYFVAMYYQGKQHYFGSYSSIETAQEVAIKERKLLFPND